MATRQTSGWQNSPRGDRVWTSIADLVQRIVVTVHADEERYAELAAQRGLSVEQLLARTIAVAVREQLERGR